MKSLCEEVLIRYGRRLCTSHREVNLIFRGSVEPVVGVGVALVIGGGAGPVVEAGILLWEETLNQS